MSGDLRYALRSLRTRPGFTLVAVVSLALGIGVNTAIFSLVDQLLLWTVPAREPARLVSLEGGNSTTYPFYREYHDRNRVFSGLLASSRPLDSALRPESSPAVEVGKVSYVSGSYFETLGVGAAAGRVLTNADDLHSGGSPVAVLSYGYWQRRFGGDLSVIGRKLAVNGQPLEIAGVAEKGFSGLFNIQRADIFLPLTMYPVTTPAATRVWNTTTMSWLSTIGRLKPGVSAAQAQAAMRVLWPQVAEAVNERSVKDGGKSRQYKNEEQVTLEPAARGVSSEPGRGLDPLQALLIATGLVLLIACANVANLLLARAVGRRREIGVRLAIGATRVRLVRQLLTESVVLAVAGGLAGIALAWWGVLALATLGLVNHDLRFQPSLTVTAFSLLLTALTAVIFGLVPAVRSARIDLADSVKGGANSSAAGSRLWLGKALIAGQVALSLTLLIGAGLFLRTLRNLDNVDLGFKRENVLMADIDPAKLGYRGHRLRTFYDQMLERARRLPGARSAALSLMTPMGDYRLLMTFSVEGYQPGADERLMAYSNSVTDGYFTTLGIPILLGRDFTAQDEPAATPGDSIVAALGRASGGFSEMPANASKVCIINESLARHLFGDSSPLGRHLSYFDRFRSDGSLEIIGVAKDVRQSSAREADRQGVIYVPSWNRGAEVRSLVLRFTGDSGPLIAALRREVRSMDSDVPVLRTRRLEEFVNGSFERERLIAWLCAFFGVLALGLAAVGLYGVIAHAVSQRTREIGIRIALGAQRADVLRMVVRESLAPVAVGLLIGLGGALGLARLVAGMLYGVAPRDPLSIALATAAMLGAALLAASIPARRATQVEPVTALKHE